MSFGSSPRVLAAASSAGVAVATFGSDHIAGMLLEHSPTARSSKAPSDPPSEFSSWHDDASSSMATLSVGDRTITVNMQRMRMGEHLKGKLQGMIRQRFENYLHINQTLQNDTGKLASLECELRAPPRGGEDAPFRTNISCNEDGTFLVYLVPEVSTLQGSEFSGSDTDLSGLRADAGSCSAAEAQQLDSRQPDSREFRRRWVTQVCEFGSSGRCHSLTALFHFGYTAWKQLGPSSGNVSARSLWGSSSGLREAARAPGHIAEEEERHPENREEEQSHAATSAVPPPKFRTPPSLKEEPPLEEPLQAGSAEVRFPEAGAASAAAAASSGSELRSLAQTLDAVRRAVDRERQQHALELCSEGLARAKPKVHCGSGGAASSSSSAAPVAAAIAIASASVNDAEDLDPATAVLQLLLLRASVQAQMQRFDRALMDAQEAIALMPTCAEAYYWQSVSLQGLGRCQEALEGMMSAVEYEPQNPLFQQTFTSLFEEISAASEGGPPSRRSTVVVVGGGGAGAAAAAAAEAALPRRPPRGGWPRGGQARDALSTTTQATHLSSRSTTPTEVSEPLSRSSSNDTLSVPGAASEDAT